MFQFKFVICCCVIVISRKVYALNGSAETPQKPARDYNGAQVWEIKLPTNFPISLASLLSNNEEVMILKETRKSVDVLIMRNDIWAVKNTLKSIGIEYKVAIKDFQEVLNAENPPITEELLNQQKIKGYNMTWERYHRLADIYDFLDKLVQKYPKRCSLKTIGTTHEGRELKVVKITNGNATNKAIFIDGGIHAREWISISTVTYLIKHIAENLESDESLKSKDWYIVPVLNPDGYEFSHTSYRMWRKNRHPNADSDCVGTDLNRNFGYKWGGKGTSSDPCAETFKGTKAFSEKESQALSNYILKSGVHFELYLTFHCYGQYILHPWGYDSVLPENHKQLKMAGDKMAEAIKETSGASYEVGSSAMLLYPAAGASDDWAKGSANISYSYTVELAKSFVTSPNEIMPVAKEIIAGLYAITKYVSQH